MVLFVLFVCFDCSLLLRLCVICVSVCFAILRWFGLLYLVVIRVVAICFASVVLF